MSPAFRIDVPRLRDRTGGQCGWTPEIRGKVLGTHVMGLRVKNIVERLGVPKRTAQDWIAVMMRGGNRRSASLYGASDKLQIPDPPQSVA
jgi:hypothetical protein